MTSSVQVNGQQIVFDDTGGDLPPIVLAHGFLMDRTMFAQQVDALSSEYRVITWDSRGFGETVWDGQPFTYWDLASDALGLLDHLGLGRAVIGGMSQGGFLSLRLALTAPERVRALILLDSQAGTDLPEIIPLYQAMIDQWVKDGPSEDLADAAASLIIGEPTLSATWISKWKAAPQEQLEEPGNTLLYRDDITDRLGQISAPALVVHGTNDLSIGFDRAEELSAGLVGSSGVVAIDGGTHAANLTHPDLVNQAIIEFLAGLSD
jgi:pimeloyl-ACP methyl ester carboxylesterase